MSDTSRTFVTESLTHKTITVVKAPSEVGSKKPSIRGMVKAAFEAGTSRAELIKQISQWHPTAAGSVKADKHINWYRSKMKAEWVMTGPWAQKATEQDQVPDEDTVRYEQNAARIEELEQLLAAVPPVEVVITAAPEESIEEQQARRLAEVEARLQAQDEQDAA